MIRKLLVLVFMSLLSILSAQSNHSRVKINLRNGTLQNLIKSGIEIDHGIYVKGKYFIGEFSQEELKLIKSSGYDYKVVIEDLEKEILLRNDDLELRDDNGCNNKPKKDYKIPNNFHLGSMAGNLTYSQMLKSLDSMSVLYPELISKKQVIDSFLTEEGRPIYWYKISDNVDKDEDEPEVLYTALHHAREPVSMMQMIFYMWYLLENYGKDMIVTHLINNRELYFIPCVNPDGYLYNEKTNPAGGGFWRKNRRELGNGIYGVDLNRNYGYEWGYDEIGSSSDSSSDTYRGDEGFSEPETKAVKYFCKNHNFIIALNFHTFGNLLIHPWGYTPKETKDSTIFKSLGNFFTSENNYNSGLAIQTVGYNANGDSDDWMYGDTEKKNKFFAFTSEVGTEGFWPQKSSILSQCKGNVFMNLSAAAVIEPYFDVKEISSYILSSKIDTLQLEVTNTGLKSGFVKINIKSIGTNILDYSENIHIDSFISILKLIPFLLSDEIEYNSIIKFEVTADNGLYETKDTIEKIFAKVDEKLITACDSLDIWDTQQGSWNITNKDFVSPDYSITDSPDGNYKENTNNELFIKNKFFVPNQKNAFLIFKAKWDIEKGYDWTAVMASTDGVNYTALCGNKTVIGSKDQLVNQPVFDGTQANWTDVEMNISDYAGDSIFIKFKMNSDPFVNGDGFYFDDLKIVSYGEKKVNTTEQEPLLNIYFSPNPANDFMYFTNLISNDKLIVKNIFGQSIYTKEIKSRSTSIHTSNWIDGIYFFYIVRNGVKSKTAKFTIVH